MDTERDRESLARRWAKLVRFRSNEKPCLKKRWRVTEEVTWHPLLAYTNTWVLVWCVWDLYFEQALGSCWWCCRPHLQQPDASLEWDSKCKSNHASSLIEIHQQPPSLKIRCNVLSWHPRVFIIILLPTLLGLPVTWFHKTGHALSHSCLLAWKLWLLESLPVILGHTSWLESFISFSFTPLDYQFLRRHLSPFLNLRVSST